jgi:hypothetical protein
MLHCSHCLSALHITFPHFASPFRSPYSLSNVPIALLYATIDYLSNIAHFLQLPISLAGIGCFRLIQCCSLSSLLCQCQAFTHHLAIPLSYSCLPLCTQHAFRNPVPSLYLMFWSVPEHLPPSSLNLMYVTAADPLDSMYPACAPHTSHMTPTAPPVMMSLPAALPNISHRQVCPHTSCSPLWHHLYIAALVVLLWHTYLRRGATHCADTTPRSTPVYKLSVSVV